MNENKKWINDQLVCEACGFRAKDIVQMRTVTVDNYTQMICGNCYILVIRTHLHGIMNAVLTLDQETMSEVIRAFTEIIASCRE
tara:strand:+ start:3455 stop:3706 length:252 start_codon:yes stop_codon:yes gene_type:complete